MTEHLPDPPLCRFCRSPLEVVFADLGMSPLANSFLPPHRANGVEPFYPLRARVCGQCFLVQLDEFETPDHIFSEYAYFSSYSTSWLVHAENYAQAAAERWGLTAERYVVELASNDGYLLRYFRDMGIPVLGVEPAVNVAEVAQADGIPTLAEFFGVALAERLAAERQADLLIGNNVLAHVPDLNDFVQGMKILLAEGGTITMEFPHLQRLVDEMQWDTIYHEHFSYFSLSTVERVFAAHGLRLFDVDELPTHGGSLRIYCCHEDDAAKPQTPRVASLRSREHEAGLGGLELYESFRRSVESDKRSILSFLIDLKNDGRRVAGYGAPAKGNTLLNYCGIGTDFLPYTCDVSPHKQGHLLPGSRIPILSPDRLREDRPDVVLILPWNLRAEIMEELAFVRDWGGRFAVRAPDLQLLD